MFYLKALGILLFLAFSIGAQSIHVRGKVIDAGGIPLANATVELVRAKLKATTGTDGLYSLGDGTGIAQPLMHFSEMRIEKGALEFHVPDASPIRITVFDVNGNQLESWVKHAPSAGTYRFNLAGQNLGKRLRILHVSLGEHSKLIPYFPLSPIESDRIGLEFLGPSKPSLEKKAAFLDTLKATATGFQAKTFALISYDLTQDIVLEANANCTAPAAPGTGDAVTLDMSVAEGPPNYLASGFIYGISQDGIQPPNALLSDIKVKRFRAGRGTTGGCGEAAWKTHWKVMKAYYAKAKSLGGSMLLLVSDNYQYDCPIPGEGGDWSTFNAFLTQFIDSVKANGMTGPDVRWELWNEADLSPTFWTGTQAQWLATWKYAYQQIRAAIPNAVIEGPSFATGASGAWMNAFLDYAKTHQVVPDIISWHIAGGRGDPANDVTNLTRALSTRGITDVKGFDLNEYGSRDEQNPGHSAWFLARFDRTGIEGMRSNWAGGSTFFSNMGDLVTTNWQPNSQYWVYKRYAEQTGLRIKTTAGSQVDALGYMDKTAGKSSIIVGNRGNTAGSVHVVIKNVPSWLQKGGSTKVLLEKMAAGTGASTGPAIVSNSTATVTCNTLIVTLDWAVPEDAYVITLSPM